MWAWSIVERLAGDYQVILAVFIVLVSSVVLLAYKHANPDNGAEHYYMNGNRALYNVMQVCYVVIVASIGFNVRFVLFEAVSALTHDVKAGVLSVPKGRQRK